MVTHGNQRIAMLQVIKDRKTIARVQDQKTIARVHSQELTALVLHTQELTTHCRGGAGGAFPCRGGGGGTPSVAHMSMHDCLKPDSSRLQCPQLPIPYSFWQPT